MAIPTTKSGLEAAGYRYSGGGTCNGKTCTAHIEWWKTPTAANMPMKYDPKTDTFKTHFEDCPDAAKFRKNKGRNQSRRRA